MKEFIKIHQNDNVAVALTPLSANRTLDVDGTEVTLREDIPQGHKFALTDIPADAQVIKYGCPIGIAKENISCGSWIHTHNIRTGLGDLLTYTYDRSVTELTPTAPRTFRGYRRPNGKVGIRNEIWIIPTVGCVNNVATAIERKAQKYVQGSVEAIKQSLLKLSNDEVVVKIIHGGVGAINESDVSLASASNAIIIGFNVRPDATAKETADREGVDIRLYRVIYNAIEDVEAAMKGMLDPVFEEKVLGHAEVRQTFKASGVGTIAGSYVLDGVFERDCSVRLTRDGIVIFEGPLASLKRFKDDVKEVKAGYECGFVFANFNDIKEGDLVEAFKMVEIPR